MGRLDGRGKKGRKRRQKRKRQPKKKKKRQQKKKKGRKEGRLGSRDILAEDALVNQSVMTGNTACTALAIEVQTGKMKLCAL